MEAHFCAFHVSNIPCYYPPTRYYQPHQGRGTGSARTHEGARATRMVPTLHDPPSLWGALKRTEGVPTPPLPSTFCRKKSENHAGIARQRFGASWRRCRRSGAYLHPVSITPTPRETRVTPWKLSGAQDECKWENNRRCARFLHVQRPQLY